MILTCQLIIAVAGEEMVKILGPVWNCLVSHKVAGT